MGLALIQKTISGIVSATHYNSLADAELEHKVPRDVISGIATDLAGSLGQPNLRWKFLYTTGIFINGKFFDDSSFGTTGEGFAIISGRIRSAESGQPDFLRANGSTLAATLLATTTQLVLTIDNTSVIINSDVAISGLTAAPSTNNTCLVNEAGAAAQEYTKHIGEQGGTLNIDTAGTEITNRIGQWAAFKNGATSEILWAFIQSGTQLTNCKRGWFFDNAGAPFLRNTFSDNGTLTLLNVGWVFVENGSTIDVTYRTPITDYVQPASPQNGDYWFDTANQKWKRYSSGSGTFAVVNRIPVGVVVMNTSACICTRSFDFSKSFSDVLNFEIQLESTTVARTDRPETEVSVYGSLAKIPYNFAKWTMPTNLETGYSEAASTTYYCYVTYRGEVRLSPERPQRYNFRRGWYHPYHAWRYVGQAFNDAASNFTQADSYNLPGNAKVFVNVASGSFTFVTYPNVLFYDALAQGGGGGGGTTQLNYGGGGGGGGCAQGKIPLERMRSHCAFTVGNNGNGANSGGTNNGQGGQSSSIAGMVGGGGNGGQGAGSGGSGGSASGGDLNTAGSAGTVGGNGVQGMGGQSGSGTTYGKGGNGNTGNAAGFPGQNGKVEIGIYT